jgi:biotin operon repressor BirA-like protein
MLRLLSLLQTHRHWSGTQLAERLGVSTRTIRRDVDRLRDLGYPVAAMQGVEGGYRLEAGTELLLVPTALMRPYDFVARTLLPAAFGRIRLSAIRSRSPDPGR